MLRYRRSGRDVAVHPVTVLEDSAERTALALVPGTVLLQPEYHRAPEPGLNRALRAVEVLARGQPALVPAEWEGTHVLMLLEPERWYSIYHLWDATTGAFLCWYVNYQRPFIRTREGVETSDLALDLVVGPDLRSGLKDEDELATYVAHGFVSPDEEAALWKAHQEVLGRVAARAFPFDGAWLDRRPDDVDAIRELPEI